MSVTILVSPKVWGGVLSMVGIPTMDQRFHLFVDTGTVPLRNVLRNTVSNRSLSSVPFGITFGFKAWSNSSRKELSLSSLHNIYKNDSRLRPSFWHILNAFPGWPCPWGSQLTLVLRWWWWSKTKNHHRQRSQISKLKARSIYDNSGRRSCLNSSFL